MDVPWSKMRVMSRIERLLHWPIVRSAYRFRFNRQFAAGAVGSFRGIYASFAEALRDAPATKPTGYDHVGPASMYSDRLSRIYPSDYPVLFWLNQLLPRFCRR